MKSFVLKLISVLWIHSFLNQSPCCEFIRPEINHPYVNSTSWNHHRFVNSSTWNRSPFWEFIRPSINHHYVNFSVLKSIAVLWIPPTRKQSPFWEFIRPKINRRFGNSSVLKSISVLWFPACAWTLFNPWSLHSEALATEPPRRSCT